MAFPTSLQRCIFDALQYQAGTANHSGFLSAKGGTREGEENTERDRSGLPCEGFLASYEHRMTIRHPRCLPTDVARCANANKDVKKQTDDFPFRVMKNVDRYRKQTRTVDRENDQERSTEIGDFRCNNY